MRLFIGTFLLFSLGAFVLCSVVFCVFWGRDALALWRQRQRSYTLLPLIAPLETGLRISRNSVEIVTFVAKSSMRSRPAIVSPVTEYSVNVSQTLGVVFYEVAASRMSLARNIAKTTNSIVPITQAFTETVSRNTVPALEATSVQSLEFGTRAAA